MKASKPETGGWTHGGFLLVAAILFVAHLGVVLLFSRRTQPSPVPVRPRVVFRLGVPLDDEQFSKYIFANDPTVFPSSSPHGFADQAWFRFHPKSYSNQHARSEQPAFLEFVNSRPASDLTLPGPALADAPLPLAAPQGPPPEVSPALPTPRAGRLQPLYRLSGRLAGQEIAPPASLRVSASDKLMTNAVVQFAVDRDGEVISARLLVASGLDDVNTNAVATVRALRFPPTRKSSTAAQWATAVFAWRVIPPPIGATNGVADALR